MLVEFSPEFVEKMSRWRERNDNDWDQQQARMKQLLGEARTLCDGMNDEGAVELLTLLNYEFEYHPEEDKSSPRMIMLREAIDRLMFTFKVIIGDVPEWFIPAYEVQYTPECLEEGTFGTAYRGTFMGAKAMIKRMMEDTSGGRKQFFTEATIWKELKHAHVIQLFGICHVSKPSFFVCEDVENGNFAVYFKIESNRRLMWRLFYEASLGIDYLHNKKIVHGNLTGNNLLIAADYKARVADFGFAFHRSASKALSKKAQAEGVRWKSPECLRGEEENPSSKPDVYSFGLCIIEAFTNEAPWTPADDEAITAAAFDYRSPARPEGMNDSMWSLVENMVCSKPDDRFSMADVCGQLETFAAEEARLEKRIQCTECTTLLEVGDKFCSSCGHPVERNLIEP